MHDQYSYRGTSFLCVESELDGEVPWRAVGRDGGVNGQIHEENGMVEVQMKPLYHTYTTPPHIHAAR